MGAYIIYLDILLLLNFCLDFLLLWAAGRFLRRRAALPRLLLSAALGAVYGAGIVVQEIAVLYSPPAVILVSLLLLRIAYPFQNAAAFLKLTGLFYLIAFAMAGSVMAVASLLGQNGMALGSASLLRTGTLLAAAPVAIVIARRGYQAVKRSFKKEDFYAELEVWLQGRSCRLKALIDTGNDLKEPLSGRPVLVADFPSLRTIFPDRFSQLYRRYGEDAAELLQQMGQGGGWTRRLRLVPFSSIGRKNGMLVGFRPDRLVLYYAGQKTEVDAVIALVPQGLGSKDTYQAVANPDVLQSYAIEKKEASA